jgi:hypothetical protein
MSTLPATAANRAHLATFFSKVDPPRGRLILAIDATASRQPTWDQATKLQGDIFAAVATTGGLDVQLVYYRDLDECVASKWFMDARALRSVMARVICVAGHTQIKRVLAHTRHEHASKKVDALAIISDACEETPYQLYTEARELSVPVFMFQEGEDPHVGEIYATIADITKGAVAKFDSSSAHRLAELLRAVAVFAAGGTKALANEKSEAARLLLTQVAKS